MDLFSSIQASILPEIVELMVIVIGAIIAWIWRQDFMQRFREDKAYAAITAAVQETWKEFVRDLKHSAEDRKLTNSEKVRAQNLAFNKAIQIAREEGVDLAKVYTERTIRGLIDNRVKESKAMSNQPAH